MWRHTPAGNAYQLQDTAKFIYLGTTPESAYFEYQLYLSTNDTLWRERALEQMGFWLKAQYINTTSRHHGVVNDVYELPAGPFDSLDRGTNPGYKPDMNAHMARYALLTWEAVKQHEGDAAPAEVADWFEAAKLSAHWVYNMAAAQATTSSGGGAPGSAGLPQKIFPVDWKDVAERDKPSISATSGRFMNALPVFARLLDAEEGAFSPDHNFTGLWIESDRWMAREVEGLLFWFGQHPGAYCPRIVAPPPTHTHHHPSCCCCSKHPPSHPCMRRLL